MRKCLFAKFWMVAVICAAGVLQFGCGEDPPSIYVDVPSGTVFHAPAVLMLIANTDILRWDLKVEGGRIDRNENCGTELSCPTTLTPLAEGQTTAGSVVLLIKGEDLHGGISAQTKYTYQFKAGTPTFSPAAGDLEYRSTVEILTETPDAEIHYTTDGTAPTRNSTLYVDPIVMEKSGTLKAIAFASGYAEGEAASAAYTVKGWMDTCAEWNAAISQRIVDCFHADTEYLAGIPGAIDCETIEQDIKAGLTGFDGDKAAGCTDSLEAMECSSLVRWADSPVPFPMPETACAEAIFGLGTGPCSRNTQCASTFCTAAATRTCPGGCQERLAADASCMSPYECAWGLTCREGRCTDYATADQQCMMHEECSPELRCLDFSCKPPLETGAFCSLSQDCSPGDSCVEGTCQQIVDVDGECTPSAAPNIPSVCAAGLWCDTDKCVKLPKIGESCSATMTCIGGYCDLSVAEPTCAAYLKTGDSCNSMTQCASGLAVDNKCVGRGEFNCATP